MEKGKEGVKRESDCGCILYYGTRQREGKRERGSEKGEKRIVGVYCVKGQESESGKKGRGGEK